FFFQAEDGIRDLYVTGVQTCALPISPGSGKHSLKLQFDGQENMDYGGPYQTAWVTPGVYRFQGFVRADGITTDQGIRFRISGVRSEERRVGKECRSGWAGDRSKR